MKVHRIILNLLGNAIKFTDKGSVSITAELVEVKNQQVVIRFTVKDTGIGILEEQQDKVFDRFHKVIPSYKGIYSGYGVGLHIVLAYVNLLGGDIQLTSKPGVGTSFDFNLAFEYLNAESTSIKPHEHSPQHDYNQVVMQGECHILIVEDNTIALKVVEAVATNAGCRFTSAKDGEQALALIQSTDFDLVITDIGLPGISGYDLTRAIRNWEAIHQKGSTPIIGLTAHTKAHAESNCFEAGMDDVYSKPITADLMQTILLKYVMGQPILETQKGTHGRLGFDLPDSEEELFALSHLPLLDIDKAISTIGNKELVCQVLQLMISEEIQKDIRVIQEAYLQGHWPEIERFAHKMKGGAMYIGTIKMQFASQYLERYIKAKHTRLLEPLYQQLIQVVNDTQDYIRSWLNNSCI
jgi:CheY-like chemotaxis protein